MLVLKKIPMINGLSVDEAHKKGAPTPEPAPLIAPTAPVEEASVEIEDSDEDKLKKIRTGKSSLKLPLADTGSTGLKV